jgi:hypothetical protein
VEWSVGQTLVGSKGELSEDQRSQESVPPNNAHASSSTLVFYFALLTKHGVLFNWIYLYIYIMFLCTDLIILENPIEYK